MLFSVNYFCQRVASLRNVTETLALGVRSNQRERPSYAGAAVEVLEGLDGWLSVRHEGRVLAA